MIPSNPQCRLLRDFQSYDQSFHYQNYTLPNYNEGFDPLANRHQ